MNKIILFLLFVGLISCSSSTTKEREGKIIVFCASSLTDVFSEIEKEFEKKYDVDVNLNFASSGTLARQIEHGAPANILISANKKWMDYLENNELTEENTIIRIAGNSLVIIVPSNSQVDTLPLQPGNSFPNSFQGRLSIGDPDYVPAGTYAKEALEEMGCYEELQNRLLPSKDVRSALMMVELGETKAGIVYKTDALKSKKVKIAGEIPERFHQTIGYYSAVIKGHKTDLTMNFYTFILSDQSKPIWKKYGYIL